MTQASDGILGVDWLMEPVKLDPTSEVTLQGGRGGDGAYKGDKS